jgi:quinoprotein glucose dehydrogenase
MRLSASVLLASAALTAAAADRPLVIAHRGGAALWPENSITAFRNAVKLGVPILEFDLVLTADNVVVLHHDTRINPAICRDAPPDPIRNLTLQQIRKLDCRAPIPTFDEVLQAFKTAPTILLGEAKTPEVAPFVYDAVKRHRIGKRFILQVTDYAVSDAILAKDPTVQVCLVNARRFKPDYLRLAKRHKATHIMLRHDDATAQQIRGLQAGGLKVFSATANHPSDWRRYVEFGFDAILTDNPSDLQEFLKNPVVEINAQNLPRLKLAWTLETNAVAPDKRTASIAAFEATPQLAGDTLYVITPFNQVIALDPEAGTERWRYDAKIAANRNYSEATARGVTVSDGKLYFGTLDARLIVLDATTGRELWQTPLDRQISDGNYQVTSPPVVAAGTVIVGSSIGDNSRADLPRGVVRAFEAATGKLKWTWDPTPPGTTGAANAWAPLSVDAARDIVFIPTGSASPDFFGGLRPGANNHANSVVALRISTGKLVWAFQAVHHDLWDYDVASRPEPVEFNGKPAVAVLTKLGHYFVLDRLTGKPLLPVEERPVPKSDVEGEAASPTQPFPASGVFTQQKFTPRPGWCADQFSKFRYEGLFTPPSLQGTLLFPGNVGGANWGSASYDRERGLLYVAANRLATAVRLIPRAAYDSNERHGEIGERWGQEYASQKGTPYGMARRTFLDPEGRPCNQEPWGAIAAIEVATGKLRWEAPILPSLGGPLALNDLVFFGGTLFEAKLRAFSANDGSKLWETDLPYSAHSVPGTYVWKNKRYLVVSAGGHGKVDGSKVGGAVIAYVGD